MQATPHPYILSMDLLNLAVGASQSSLIDNKNMIREWAWPLWRMAAVTGYFIIIFHPQFM
jgi:uncharacterized membrane protein YozB (DUF420 family)